MTQSLSPDLAHFAAVTDQAFFDNAPRFTCAEIEAIAELFRAAGRDDTAADIVDAHVRDDEEGDDEAHLERRAELIAEEEQGNEVER